MPEFIKRKARQIDYITAALVDPKGYGQLQLMLENALIPKQHRGLFHYSHEEKIFVDCGANIGKITDIARFCGMEVFAFEPSKFALELLEHKYRDDDKVHLYPVAVSNQEGEIELHSNHQNPYDEGATTISQQAEYLHSDTKYQVKVARLIDVLQNDVLSKYDRIHMLKIDVEGAEFDIIPDIIDSKIYEKIDYIFCETHERFFGKKSDEKIKYLQAMISKNNIKNIYLDWI